ncbi:MAG: hypothetical protein AAF648_01465 [Pseudomonadota bacterium]
MRFVVGLIFGSLVTLGAAALLEWPSSMAVSEAAKDQNAERRPVASEASVTELPEPPAQEPLTPELTTAAVDSSDTPIAADTSDTSETPDTSGTSGTEKPSLIAAKAVNDLPPIKPALVPIESNLPPGVPLARRRDFSLREADERLSGDGPEKRERGEAPAAPTATASGDGAMSAVNEVSVWTPFHSEASARGFARRLSTQLGYPFSVTKVAAAEYHVVFAYADDAQRALLEQQVTSVTGRAL